MIQVVLKGKSLGYEYTEDILTSTVFGNLRYIRPDLVLIPFIESAFLYNEARTTLWEKLNIAGIELRCFQKVEYIFWAWNQNYGEPDLILIFRDHIHGLDDLLIVVEVKFKSKKSGTDENDQLARYFEAIHNNMESFTELSVSDFKGEKGYIVYLTEAEACSDITATTQIINRRYDIRENVFHLRWHLLYKTLEKMYSYLSSCEKVIVDDLIKYLEKLGLVDFSGISLPPKSLIADFSVSYPIFYNEGKSALIQKTYFDHLNDINIELDENIFYKGE